MKNESKYSLNENTGKWDVMYRGFDYMTFSGHDWKVVKSFDTEDEARSFADRCVDFGD